MAHKAFFPSRDDHRPISEEHLYQMRDLPSWERCIAVRTLALAHIRSDASRIVGEASVQARTMSCSVHSSRTL